MGKIQIAVILILLQSAVAAIAAENRFVQFNTDVENAYSKYRVALFQTNQDDMAKSEQANKAFCHQWNQIVTVFAANPPEVYSSDPLWQPTLEKVGQIAQKSGELIQAGEFAEAHEMLEEIRDQLSQLRSRNSVIVFSDYINNYHQAMEALVNMPLSAKSISSDQLRQVDRKLAVLEYLAGAIQQNAPDKLRDQEKYQVLEQGLFRSIDELKTALAQGDAERIKKAVKMLKPAYAKLFVHFG